MELLYKAITTVTRVLKNSAHNYIGLVLDGIRGNSRLTVWL